MKLLEKCKTDDLNSEQVAVLKDLLKTELMDKIKQHVNENPSHFASIIKKQIQEDEDVDVVVLKDIEKSKNKETL